MEMDQCEEEDEIEREMERDDIGEILGLAKDVSLYECKGIDDPWCPSAKSKFIEKTREEECLSEIREMEWDMFFQQGKDRIHEKEFIPDPESIGSEEEEKYLPPSRLHRPV